MWCENSKRYIQRTNYKGVIPQHWRSKSTLVQRRESASTYPRTRTDSDTTDRSSDWLLLLPTDPPAPQAPNGPAPPDPERCTVVGWPHGPRRPALHNPRQPTTTKLGLSGRVRITGPRTLAGVCKQTTADHLPRMRRTANSGLAARLVFHSNCSARAPAMRRGSEVEATSARSETTGRQSQSNSELTSLHRSGAHVPLQRT